MLAIGQLETATPEVDASEAADLGGLAIQNMLLTAHAMGFGCRVDQRKALKSAAFCGTLFRWNRVSKALCFINIGTPHKMKPARQRPAVESYVTVLADD